MQLSLKPEHPLSKQNKLLIGIAIIFVALLAIIRAYHLDRTQPSARYVYHVIPIALSVLYFDWPYDYTGNSAVEGAYIGHGIRYVLDHREEYRDQKKAYYWTADDRGALDLTVAGFYLFGPKVDSMAYFYALVLAASVIVFCLSHRESAAALGTLAISLLSLGVCFGIWNFVNKQAGTSPGFGEGAINLSESRLFGLLAFFPILSLYYVIVQKKPLSGWQWMGAAFQALLYTEILHARMSVLWLLPPLVLVAFAGIFSESIAPAKRNAYAILALALLTLFTKDVYEHAVYNPAYYADRGSRTIWHNVLMGLSDNPFFYDELGIQLTDPVAARLVLRYNMSGILPLNDQHLTTDQLRKVDEDADTAMNSLASATAFDWPNYEREARGYVSAIFKTYPEQFLATFLWYKPVEALRDIGLLFLPHSLSGSSGHALPMIYPLLIVLLVVAVAARRSSGASPSPPQHRTFHAFMAGCLVFSAAVPIAFYPAPTQVADSVLILLVWGFTFFYRFASTRFASRITAI